MPCREPPKYEEVQPFERIRAAAVSRPPMLSLICFWRGLFYDSERFDRFETVMNLSYPVSKRSQGSEGLVNNIDLLLDSLDIVNEGFYDSEGSCLCGNQFDDLQYEAAAMSGSATATATSRTSLLQIL